MTEPDWRTHKYREAADTLRDETGAWIDRHRNTHPLPSWQRISRLLYTETGMEVSHESLRNWWTRWDKHGRPERVT